MAWTPPTPVQSIWVDGAAGGTPLSAANLNQAETNESVYAQQVGASVIAYAPDVWAPAPSGDATGAADSTAVQALVDALSAAGGGNVNLKPGTYWGNLTLKPGVRLVGRGRGKTIWKAPSGYSGIVMAGLNWATLTGKTYAAGDYLLGASGCGVIGMTVDANSAASNCITVWSMEMLFDDLIVQNATGHNLITEFTNIDNSLSPAQRVDCTVGDLRSYNAGGDGWLNRHEATVGNYAGRDNTGWALTIDAVTGSYQGGMFAKYLQGYNNHLGGARLLGGYLQCPMAELDGDGTLTTTGLQFSSGAGLGASKVTLLANGHLYGLDLAGTGHKIMLTSSNGTNAARVTTAQKCTVELVGCLNNTNVLNIVSESGPNLYFGEADIPSSGALFTGAALNSQSTVLISANGAGGTFSTTQLPNGTLGFFGKVPVAKPTVTGAKGGNAALASLLTALAAVGLLTDSST